MSLLKTSIHFILLQPFSCYNLRQAILQIKCDDKCICLFNLKILHSLKTLMETPVQVHGIVFFLPVFLPSSFLHLTLDHQRHTVYLMLKLFWGWELLHCNIVCIKLFKMNKWMSLKNESSVFIISWQLINTFALLLSPSRYASWREKEPLMSRDALFSSLF